jgi:Domain of unknown function (DUF4878)
MKKITNLFFFAGIIALLATGCKGKDSVANDPKTVVTAFFAKMAAKDMDGAAKLCTKGSQSTMDMMKKGMEAAEKMGADKKKDDQTEDFKNVGIGEAKINGDDATVAITNKKEGKTIDFPLKKEDGDWKVDFSMGTLMKMGMNEMNNKKDTDAETEDMNTEGLDKMMNADTLKESLEKAQEMLKNIKPEDMEKMKEMMEKMKKMEN